MGSERKLAKRRQRPPLIDRRPGTPPENMTNDPGNHQPPSASAPTPDKNSGGYARTDAEAPEGRAAQHAGDPQAESMDEGRPD